MCNVYIPAPFMSTHYSNWALMQRCGANALSWSGWAVKHRTSQCWSMENGTRSKQWLRFHHCCLVPLVWLMINATALFMAVISKIAAPTCHIMGLKARASKYMEVSDIYFNPVILRTMFSKPHPHPVILPKERNQNRAVAKQEWCLHLQKSGEFIRNFSSKPTTPLSIPPSK